MKQFAKASVAATVVAAIAGVVHADTYTFIDIGTPDTLRNVTPVAINESGEVLSQGRFPLDIEINLELISNQQKANAGIPIPAEDEDPITELTAAQYDRLLPQLEDIRNGELRSQRVGFNRAVRYNGTLATDKFFLSTAEQLENSSDSFITGLNEAGMRVGYGSAPYEGYEFTRTVTENDEEVQITETFHRRAFTTRGVWQWGAEQTVIEPPFTEEFGGESALFDINDNNVAVGYASVALSPFAVEEIADCKEAETSEGAFQPANACIWGTWLNRYNGSINYLRTSFFDRSVIIGNNSIYDNRAYLWQLDSNGNVLSATEFGTLLPRDAEDQQDFSSYAYAVNNQDIAVGQSWTYRNGEFNSQSRIKMPAIFIDGEARPVTTDEVYAWGAALDINDNNQVVGYVKKSINNYLRDVAFIYDLNAENPELVELPRLFDSSSTVVNAINNNGVVVGTAESEASINENRRRIGFYMDLTAESPRLIDLNDAIACNRDYFIVSAEDINDQGDIVATAVVEETYTRDDGEEDVRLVSRTLVMNPTAGEVNNCSATRELTERQGAASGLGMGLGILLIGVLITTRRRIIKGANNLI